MNSTFNIVFKKLFFISDNALRFVVTQYTNLCFVIVVINKKYVFVSMSRTIRCCQKETFEHIFFLKGKRYLEGINRVF